MRLMRSCRQGLALGLAVLAIFSGASQASARDQAKVEVVPSIPHTEPVTSVAFSLDGTRVLSGSGDKTLKLWDVASGLLIRTFEGHSHQISSVAFSPDGMRLLSGSLDNTLKLWDAASGQVIRTLEGHSSSVQGVAFSPDGTRLVSGNEDGTLKLWDAASGRLIRTFVGHSGWISSVAFSPDGTRLLSGSHDFTLKLWDAVSGRLIRTLEGHSNPVSSVAFSRDGMRLLSGSWDHTLKLWDAAKGQVIRTFEGHSRSVESVALSPDGRRLLSGSKDRTLKLWDAVSGRLIRTLEAHHGLLEGVTSVAFSPDGMRLLSGGGDLRVKLWHSDSGELIRTFEGPSEPVRSVVFSPDGTRLLSGGWDGLKLWDAVSGQLIRTLTDSDQVSQAAFSPDGTRLLAGSRDRTLKLWEAASGQLMRSFQGHSDRVTSVAFSPDSTRLLSGSWDKTFKLWDAANGQVIRTFGGHSGWVTLVAYSPDGKYLLSGSDNRTLKLWEAASGQLIRTFAGHSREVTSVVFSSDGTRLLSGSLDNTLKLWAATSGQLIRTFDGHSDGVISVAFSPDGMRLLSGSYDTTLKLWDATGGQLIRTFNGHFGRVASTLFSPDGRRTISGSDDTTIRIWDTETGAQLAALTNGRNGKWLAATPPGFFASSGNANDLLVIVRGLEVATIDQVHQSLFNPDLVREALAGDPSGEVRDAAKVINLEKVLDSGPAPIVAITSPADGSQSTLDLATITARIEDRGKGVGRVEWRVNGITAAVATKPPGSGPIYTATRQLALDPGDNVVEVVAYNASNLLASLPARTTIKFTGPADKTKPKLHILAIGINAYVDRGSPLRFGPLGLAVKDATAFGASMKKAAAGLYDGVRVTLALDKAATRDNLERVIAKVAREIHPRDSFILFAAGHGSSENGRFYFIPQDYQSGPGHLARRAIGQDRLQDWLANRIKARKALILLDTCESGALVAGHKRSRLDVPISEAGVGRLHEATGRPVLVAAAEGQDAIESDIPGTSERHGFFTYALLHALRHGDTNGNGLIELSELVAHVQDAVPKIAAGKGLLPRGLVTLSAAAKQSARFGSRGEDFVLVRRLQ